MLSRMNARRLISVIDNVDSLVTLEADSALEGQDVIEVSEVSWQFLCCFPDSC